MNDLEDTLNDITFTHLCSSCDFPRILAGTKFCLFSARNCLGAASQRNNTWRYDQEEEIAEPSRGRVGHQWLDNSIVALHPYTAPALPPSCSKVCLICSTPLLRRVQTRELELVIWSTGVGKSGGVECILLVKSFLSWVCKKNSSFVVFVAPFSFGSCLLFCGG